MNLNYNLANLKQLKKDELLGIILFILAIIYLIFVSYLSLTKIGLWFDELFTLHMVEVSLKKMITLGIRDVHPLGYYILLRGFKDILSIFNLKIEVIGTIFSLIPMYLLLILSITKIKKNFGMLCAGIFSLCIITMPQLMLYSREIRMYSWGLFFLTATFVYLYEIKNDSNIKNWSLLTIFTIGSIHMHYFTAMTSIVIYILLLKDVVHSKAELKKWIISSCICLLAYIPWIPYAFSQVFHVGKSYWIKPITFDTIISYFCYIFSPAKEFITGSGNTILKPELLGILLVASLILLLAYNYVNGLNDKEKYSLKGLLIVFLIPLIGVIISLIKTPVFFMRYLVPLLGILWLSYSILLTRSFNRKKIFYPILIIILIVGLIGTAYFVQITQKDYISYENKKNAIHDVIENKSFILTNISESEKILFLNTNTTIIFKDGMKLNKLLKELDNYEIRDRKIYLVSKSKFKKNTNIKGYKIITKDKIDHNVYAYQIKKIE